MLRIATRAFGGVLSCRKAARQLITRLTGFHLKLRPPLRCGLAVWFDPARMNPVGSITLHHVLHMRALLVKASAPIPTQSRCACTPPLPAAAPVVQGSSAACHSARDHHARDFFQKYVTGTMHPRVHALDGRMQVCVVAYCYVQGRVAHGHVANTLGVSGSAIHAVFT